MALTLNHYTIRTTDLEGCRSFYETVLGLINGPRPAFDFPGAWMYRADPNDPINAVVHIIGITRDSVDTGSPRMDDNSSGSAAIDHIAFSATGLRDMLAHLTKNNVPYRERTVPGLDLHQVFLHDPLNIKIELNYAKHEKEAVDRDSAQ